MSTRPTPTGSPEEDPTGVRAILAALPDPGPMPPELVVRIAASIAAEQAARAPHEAPEPVAVEAEVTRLPRRRLWRTAGLAAAAALVIGTGGASVLSATGSGPLGALFGSGDSESATTAGEGAVDTAGGEDSGLGGPGIAGAAGPVSVHHTGRGYTAAGLPDQASRLLTEPGGTLEPGAVGSPAVGPLGTEAGVQACLAVLGAVPAASVVVDLGTFEGEPAAVLVLRTGSGSVAYAVERGCGADGSGALAGPVNVP